MEHFCFEAQPCLTPKDFRRPEWWPSGTLETCCGELVSCEKDDEKRSTGTDPERLLLIKDAKTGEREIISFGDILEETGEKKNNIKWRIIQGRRNHPVFGKLYYWLDEVAGDK